MFGITVVFVWLNNGFFTSSWNSVNRYTPLPCCHSAVSSFERSSSGFRFGLLLTIDKPVICPWNNSPPGGNRYGRPIDARSKRSCVTSKDREAFGDQWLWLTSA